jgi:hypothetical protein
MNKRNEITVFDLKVLYACGQMQSHKLGPYPSTILNECWPKSEDIDRCWVYDLEPIRESFAKLKNRFICRVNEHDSNNDGMMHGGMHWTNRWGISEKGKYFLEQISCRYNYWLSRGHPESNAMDCAIYDVYYYYDKIDKIYRAKKKVLWPENKTVLDETNKDKGTIAYPANITNNTTIDQPSKKPSNSNNLEKIASKKMETMGGVDDIIVIILAELMDVIMAVATILLHATTYVFNGAITVLCDIGESLKEKCSRFWSKITTGYPSVEAANHALECAIDRINEMKKQQQEQDNQLDEGLGSIQSPT